MAELSTIVVTVVHPDGQAEVLDTTQYDASSPERDLNTDEAEKLASWFCGFGDDLLERAKRIVEEQL